MNLTNDEFDDLFRNASKKVINPIYQERFFDEISDSLPKKSKKTKYLWFLTPLLILPFIVKFESKSTIKSAEFIKVNEFDSKLNLNKNKNLKDVLTLKKNSKEKAIINQKVKQSNAKNKINSNLINSNEISLNENYSNLIIKDSPLSLISGEAKLNFENLSNKEVLNNVSIYQINLLKYNDLIEFYGQFNKEIKSYKQINNLNKNYYFVNLNLGLSESFLNNSSAKSIPTIGVNVGYGRKIKSFNTEIGFQFTSFFPQNLEFNKQSKVYGIRVNRYAQEINYKTIFSLEIPISFSKQFKNHLFTVGIAPVFNLGSKFDLIQSENQQNKTTETYFGSRYGLNNWNLKPTIEYHYNFKNNFQIGFNVSTNLESTLDEEVLNFEANKFPILGQISIKKALNIK
jgi:hypothetical protein